MQVESSQGRPGRRLAALAIVLAASVAAVVCRQPHAPSTVAAQPAAGEPDTLTRRHTELHVRYAEARLAAAIADLEKALDLVRVQPGLVAESEIRRLRSRVEVLRGHVEATRRQPHGNSVDLAVAAARTASDQAEHDLGRARSANALQPDAVSRRTIRQLETRADVARARVALWEDPAFLQSPLHVMQMQIDQLSDHVLDLAHRADKAPAVDLR
jgi:hypothetical protein